MVSKRFERGQRAYTFSIDLKHWLFGVNWNTETLFDSRKHFMGIHLGPFCYVASWPASSHEKEIERQLLQLLEEHYDS